MIVVVWTETQKQSHWIHYMNEKHVSFTATFETTSEKRENVTVPKRNLIEKQIRNIFVNNYD